MLRLRCRSQSGCRSEPRYGHTGVGYARTDIGAIRPSTQSSEVAMKRLYADFNNIAADGTLTLSCWGSVDSIAALVQPLTDGEEVMLSDDDLEVVARVYQRDDGSWEARSDWRFVV